jgi:hypothetical protein
MGRWWNSATEADGQTKQVWSPGFSRIDVVPFSAICDLSAVYRANLQLHCSSTASPKGCSIGDGRRSVALHPVLATCGKYRIQLQRYGFSRQGVQLRKKIKI